MICTFGIIWDHWGAWLVTIGISRGQFAGEWPTFRSFTSQRSCIRSSRRWCGRCKSQVRGSTWRTIGGLRITVFGWAIWRGVAHMPHAPRMPMHAETTKVIHFMGWTSGHWCGEWPTFPIWNRYTCLSRMLETWHVMCNLLEIFATCWCGRKITVSIKVKLYTGCACDLSLDRHANLETGAAIGIGLYTDVHGPLATKRSSRRSSHSAKIAKLFTKSQKVKKFSTFRFFRLFEQKSPGMWPFRLFDFSQKVKRSNFSIFSIFSTFRAEISWNVNFSAFRVKLFYHGWGLNRQVRKAKSKLQTLFLAKSCV